MNEQSVKQLIGEENWEAFCEWISGQTVSVNQDGSINYYDWDVEAFKTKLDTNYDRQKDFQAFD